MSPIRPVCAVLIAAAWCAPAAAQQGSTRTRVVLGPQLVPSYPGADGVSLRPLVDVSRARDDDPFAFEAPDESFGPALFQGGRLVAGPSVGFEGRRRGQDVGTALPTVGFTVELGGFVQYQVTDPVRVRAEVRRGVGGHDGWIAAIGADYVARDRDEWLWSVGPRLTVTDGRYQRAYFGVRPQDAAASGLPEFDAGGGVQAVGVTAGHLRQLTGRWGLYGYARYDRLVADAARSPVVRRYGSRDQLSGGIALSYTFGR